ncbi:MAG: molecular chaperone HtpG [Kiritimatiellia bacterium]
MSKPRTRAFKTEVSDLLHLVIHSLYSKKEIFLRELVSNASDAIDRAHYEGLTDKSLVSDSPDWAIDLIADKEKKTLVIEDNGIGMSADDLEKNLGTIASSGTRAFLESLKGSSDAKPDIPEMIGQFGVGFYAAFMVAESVVVDSLRRGEGQTAVRWSSKGEGTYTLSESDRTVPGTRITLHIREDSLEFLDEWRIREIIRRYSDFIVYPIRLATEGKEIDRALPALNTMRALWRRPKAEVKPEEYKEFYQHLAHDYQEPLKTIHLSVEGQLEFYALLFIPKTATQDLFIPGRRHGLQLYVRNVFIGSDFEALLPENLRFVRGVVDSSDLPLNVSREMLQDEAVIRKIRSNLAGKILSTLKEMRETEPDDYLVFFRTFGRILKEGLHSDIGNSDKLKELFLYESAVHGNMISLREYRDAMPESQKAIYHLCAETIEDARRSPHLEAFRSRGIDVLLMGDPIDEWILPALDEYDGVPFHAIDKGDVDLSAAEEKEAVEQEREEATRRFQPLMDFMQAHLSEFVKETRIGKTLVDSPAVLARDTQAINPAVARMLRSMGQDVPVPLRILEINPAHPLIVRLAERLAANRDDPALVDLVDLLYDQSLVAEGSPPRDPAAFSRNLTRLMVGE